jgi:hypothetical protein
MILLDAALNALRLAVFMFILKSWSYVFMTIMFFILGPLADFFIVVVLYSNYVAGLSTRFQKESAAWKWSF